MADTRVFDPAIFQHTVFQVGDLAPTVSTFGGDISAAFVVDSGGTRPHKRRIPLEMRRLLMAELRKRQREEARQRGDSMFATRAVSPHSVLRTLPRE
jgi:hypothetical protein